MAKKRINIYVDEDIYSEFKTVCSVTGETVTSVIDQAMKEYTKAIKMIIEAGDKDTLMDMIKNRLNMEVNNIEKEIDSRIEAQRD